MRHRFAGLMVACLLVWGHIAAAGAADVAPSELQSKIEKIVTERVKWDRVASYGVGVVKYGQVVLARGFGLADLENDVPATAESVYRIGSMTKQFTAMAIMLLAEQGKLSLDDDLSKFLPDYPLQGHKVSIHQLLNHTSGIKPLTETQPMRAQHNHLNLARDAALAWFQNEPFEFEPGSRFKYNNSGYWLLGLVIEKASGKSYADYVQEQIFGPLEMKATRLGDLRPIIRHRVAGYQLTNGELVNCDVTNMNLPSAAGSLVSNIDDLMRWHLALEQGKLISLASYESMYRPTKLDSGPPPEYAYGWQTLPAFGHKRLSHGGAIQGFRSLIARYPDDRLAVIVLTNTEGGNVEGVERRLAKLLLGVAEDTVVDLPADEPLLHSLVGKYQNGSATLEVTSEGGQLYMHARPRAKTRLLHQGMQLFVSEADDERTIQFNLQDGRAESLEFRLPGQRGVAQRVE